MDKYIYVIFDSNDSIIGMFLDKRAAEIHLAWLNDNKPTEHFEAKKFNTSDDVIDFDLYSSAVIHKGITVYFCPYDEQKYGNGSGWGVGSEFTSLKQIPDKSVTVESPDHDPKFTEHKISFEYTGEESMENLIEKAKEIYGISTILRQLK